jgi:hypothetical protein
MLTILNIDTDANRLVIIGLFSYFIKACAMADEETGVYFNKNFIKCPK